jgi:3-hydroxyisobutyrate dehydrogenase/2-hydroxy-3-oxopropionate reductase
MTVVALLGTGRMGSAMARSIARGGFELVLFNRSPAKAESLATELGATVAESAAHAVAAATVVISMVSNEAAVEELYRGPDGILDGLAPGRVLLEMSTVPPYVCQGLDDEVSSRGGTILDAPVSGSVPLAEAGTLTIMVGGDAGALEQARPVLEAMSSRIFHMGPLGTGATIKLAVNSIIFALNQSLSEALVLAERAGVERATAYEVFANSAIAAPYTKYKEAAFVDPAGTPVAFSLELAAKDLDLILTLARAAGATMEQTETNLAIIEAAIASVGPGADLSAIAEHLRGT